MQKEKDRAGSSRLGPNTDSSGFIVLRLAAIEKAFLKDLGALCHEAADTDNPAVLEATIRQFETVPAQLRRLRTERLQLAAHWAPVAIRHRSGPIAPARDR